MVTIVGKDKSQVKQITCKNCSSILEYTVSEEQRSYTSDYLGDKDWYNYILCPCCNTAVTTRNY